MAHRSENRTHGNEAPADPRSLRRFLLALVPPLVAIAIQALLTPFFRPSTWFLFYPAVFVSAWIGGLRAAVVASVLAGAVAVWLFTPPESSFVAPSGQYVALAVFLATSFFFGVFHERLREEKQRSAAVRHSAERGNEELRRANDALGALLEQAPDGIFVADTTGRITNVNTAGCRLLGRTRAAIAGRTIAELVRGDTVEQVEREHRELREGRRQTAEWILAREDGADVPVEVTARTLSDGRWQGVFRDNRARRELEAALRASHADLERAQAVAGVGSWRLDVRHDVLVWSDEEYRIFGVPVGTPMTYAAFLACVHPEDRAYVDAAWNAGLRGEVYDVEHRVLVDGEVRWVRERADLERDERGAVIGGIGITHDVTERKRYEEELRVARERVELALRGADLGAWDWNIETGEVVFSPRWCEMRGLPAEEVVGHVDTWMSGVHPDDRSRLRASVDAYLAGGAPEYEAEYRARTTTGEWIWILDRGKVFERDDRGRPLRMVGTELDVTARKRVEEELRLAQARASGIIATSADAIVSVDEAQRITLFNEGAERMFGYRAEEVIGAPLELLVPERVRDAHRRDIAQFAAGAEVARRMGDRGMAVTGVRKSGEEFPVDAAISKVDVDGTVMLTVSVRDVTEQKRHEREQALLAEVGAVFASTLDYEATLRTIARLAVRDLADFCLIEVMLDGKLRRERVEARDPEMARVASRLERTPLDRARPHLAEDVVRTRRPMLVEHLTPDRLRALSQGEEHLRALRALEAESLIVVPLLAHGHLLGALTLLSSARAYGRSDLRLAEELAVRAAFAIENAHLYRLATRAIRARDEVVGIVAHDLRNPLGVISMQAQLLRRPRGAPERRSPRPAEAIERAACRMDRLIQDLLDMSRIEAGRLSIDAAAVSATGLVSDLVEAQKPLAASASIELRVDLPPMIGDVWADRDRLLQVFENLVTNALKFTAAGGRITIGARPREGEVVFSVADTGIGMPAEALPHVFDRFWQAPDAKRTGVGLGLSIVKGIVEAHGGRAWVESTLGRGTTFYFTIPTAPRAEQRAEAAPLPR